MSLRRCFHFCQTLAAGGVDDAARFLDAFAQSGQFFGIDPVILGIAGLDVSVLQLLEHRAVLARFAGPGIDEPKVNPFGPGAQRGRSDPCC